MLSSILRPFLAASLLWTTVYSASHPSEGCGIGGQSSLTPGGSSKSFTFKSHAAADGSIINRRLRVYMPMDYGKDKPAPLIIALHGNHRNGTSFEAVTAFSRPEYNSDALVVYPDGVDVSGTRILSVE